jgi:hypothetical protein
MAGQLIELPQPFATSRRTDRLAESSGPSSSNPNDHCAMHDGCSNGRATGTDNDVRGSSKLARLVAGSSLAD